MLESSAGSSYLWSTGETGQQITVRTTGSYSVRVANALGCLSLDSDPVDVTVNTPPAKPVITGPAGHCEGDSAELSAPLSASYLWSTGETTQNIYVTSGSYTVRVTDADGCSSELSDPHVVSMFGAPAKPVITGDNSYCEGDSVLLSSPAADSYLWSSGETTRTIHGTAGSYTVVIRDANGCASPLSDPFAVSENPKPATPVITAGGPTNIWEGDSVILGTDPAAAYLWAPGGETSSEITVRTAGDYTVSIADASGCQSDPSAPVTVTVQSIEKPIISVQGDTEFCEDGTPAILSTTEAVAYEWSNGETTRTIEPASSGSYSVRIFNELG